MLLRWRGRLYELRASYNGNIFRVFFIFDDADVLKNKSISICRKPDMYLKCLRLKK